MKKQNIISNSGSPLEAHVASSKIIVSHIDKVYTNGKKSTKAIDDVSIDIQDNDFVCIVGPSGCGKSTLLKLMTKIIYPNEGTIETHGKLTSLLELGAGFHQDFTGRENIYFNAAVFGLTKAEIEKRVDDIIEFSELGEFIDNPVRTYSSGMYMRLAFSIAINVDAEILLIDEILAVGDQHFQEKCYAKLEELRDSKKTIVIVSHSLDVVRSLCNRAVWIYKGKVKMDGEPFEVVESYLDQINQDFIEKSAEEIKSGKAKVNGLCWIDEPISYSIYEPCETDAVVKGWVMSNDANASMSAKIDGVEIEVERSKRPDVLRVYGDKYGGREVNSLPGWEGKIDVSKLSLGKHEFTLEVFDRFGNSIASKKSIMVVKG